MTRTVIHAKLPFAYIGTMDDYFRKVLDHIEGHLSLKLALKDLAEIARMSTGHFLFISIIRKKNKQRATAVGTV